MKRGMTLWRYFTDSQEHAGGFIMVKAVVGANWGDEGKGKITDMLAEKADIIIRFQGGANAGHTIINDYGKFALHTLPSGVFYGHTTSIIGNGVAVDIPVLFKEIQSIIDRDVPMPKILVSDRAQMVMSYHKNFDAYEEERLGGKSFGSTKSGIAPFYSDKYAKIGFQVSELFDDELLKEKVVRVCEQKNVILEHLKPVTAKLREAGCEVIEMDNSIRVIGPEKLKAVDVKTLPHPGFPTDVQAQFMAMLTVARGTGVVIETVFENRFMHVAEFNRMGADIKIEGRTAVVKGVDQLYGANVNATDLRAGAALILCGLIAEGETQIGKIYHIQRGYVDIDKKIRSLGGNIEIVEC